MNKAHSAASKTNLTDSTSVGGVCHLPQWGVIAVQGADAKTFLHAQLSQDVLLLETGQGRFATYCNPQGRMLAGMYLVLVNPEEILLVCNNSVLHSLLKRLSMFVLRAKVILNEASQWQVYGKLTPWDQKSLALEAHWGQGDDHNLALQPTQGWARSLLLAPTNTKTATNNNQNLLALWNWLAVCSGVADITADNTGQYTPQMLNYESVGAINFKKGCYPGQEVVARSQFRGQVKRRAYLLESGSEIAPDTELFTDAQGNNAVGTVVQIAVNPDSDKSMTAPMPAFAAIACLHNEASEHATLYTAAGNAVQVRPMPYDLLEDI